MSVLYTKYIRKSSISEKNKKIMCKFYTNFIIFDKYSQSNDKIGREIVPLPKFNTDFFDYYIISYDRSVLSFANFSPLASSNCSRRSATVSFFFCSPDISRMILP